MGSQVDLWAEVLERYLGSEDQLDLFSESFEPKQKAELVQISTQTQISTIGGRADALPSAPDKSAFPL